MSDTQGLDWVAREKVAEAVRRSVMRLSGAVNSLKTYPVDHPSQVHSQRGVAGALSEVHQLIGTFTLHFEPDGVSMGELRSHIDPAEHPHMRELSVFLRERDTLALTVEGRVAPEQIQRLLALLNEADTTQPRVARESINRTLAEEGLGHLQLAAAAADSGSAPMVTDPAGHLLEQYLELCAHTEDLLVHGARTGTLSAIGRTVDILVPLLVAHPSVVPGLVEAGHALAYESRHVANTTLLSIGVAIRLGIGLEATVHLARAVATMDVGMTVLPAEVRRSGREFLPHEVAVMRTHPLETVRSHLRDHHFDLGTQRQLVVAMEQHLGVDRTGYPDIELWPPLHLFSRIAAVCDAYDALVSTTAWRKGLSAERALTQLSPPDDHSHDPVLVAELCAVVRAFPEACRVRLSTGEIGAVLIANGPDGLPVVRIEVGDRAGQRIEIGARDDAGTLSTTIAEVMIAPEQVERG